MTPVVAIRPEPGCSATVRAAREISLEVGCFPLSEVVASIWDMPGGAFDGILAGSANAFRFGGPLVDKLVDMPVYAVGETTAAAAREKGFAVAVTGSGGLQSVLDTIAGRPLRLLRIGGEERVALQAPEGVDLVDVMAYRVETAPISGKLQTLLHEGAVVLLHSAASARHFTAECERLALDRTVIRLAALGPRIAAAAGEGWGALRAAAEPNDAALLALARDLCHEPFSG